MLKEPTYPELLRSLGDKLCDCGVYDELVRRYPQFEYWSGSHNKMLHHYGDGGLARHTWEVVNLGMNVIPILNLCEMIDPFEYYLAGLFHDTGKMYDYEPVQGSVPEGSPHEWNPTSHRRLIHHLPRSVLIFHDVIGKFPELSNKYHDSVVHAILSHHGRRDDGSPVSPKTRVAWLCHLCDGISARMDDAERIDVVKKPAINI